ncbi:MAG: DNA repair ATPase [Lentisphaeria bacterium]|nr:DNA repair ATPase [Lentisphaeria bacterium]
MADADSTPKDEQAQQPEALGGGAYEVLRKRLQALNTDLVKRLESLNASRKELFGGQESQIIGNDRIPTENNCVPRDIIGVGNRLVFGYNVHIGLKTETKLEDVFSVHEFDGEGFRGVDDSLLAAPAFRHDFCELYKYYKNARFLQFIKTTGRLLFLFQVGNTVTDLRIFRFSINNDGTLSYIDDRGEGDLKLPSQQQFEWTATTRDDQVQGMHPHINILDRIFVECIGGDLTIKVENNTDTGSGIVSESVDHPDQTLDDADIQYATVGELILLKILPYRETAWRHFVFNGRNQTAVRTDSIAQACIELPEDHGIIFPRGYYLREGGVRLFDEDVAGMIFLESIPSPNGEDFLYVFYHEEQGRHLLFQYNLITKELANPLFCHGYSLYGDGRMIMFNAPDDEPRRIHPMQIWQTPFCGSDTQPDIQSDSILAKIGNRELVRAISEGYGVSRLIMSEEITLDIYNEIIRATTNALDGHYWLDQEEAGNIAAVVRDLKAAAVAAIGEYEKVLAIRGSTDVQMSENQAAVRQCLLDHTPDRMGNVDDYVNALGELRARRGQVISLREQRYADQDAIAEMDAKLADAAQHLAHSCADFLLGADTLKPYVKASAEIAKTLAGLTKLVDIDGQSEKLEDLASRLDLLTDVVNNLEISDATKTTQIVDTITDVYAVVNRTRAAIRNRRSEVGKAEASAEFAAQFKLASQAITNYIGMCDSPKKCDEYLTKVMISIEELEGKFAEFDEYVAQLGEKREEAYSAFSARKQVLDEERQRRVGTLESSAQRILAGAVNRAETFKDVDEVNAYFASDMMVAKLRDIIAKLHAMEESVKGDDLAGQLKSARDEIIRRLRDKIDLFTDGDNIISFGDYKFTVNTQSLELTTVYRGGEMCYHLTGTDFYERIDDPEFQETRPFWDQEIVSEYPEVYRGEYLAYQVLRAAVGNDGALSLPQLAEWADDPAALLKQVREFSAGLYNEGYEKGVHDADAAAILAPLITLHQTCGLLRYDSECRACAILFWCLFPDKQKLEQLRTRMQSFGDLPRLFGLAQVRKEYIAEMNTLITGFFGELGRSQNPVVLGQAAEYLYYELQDEEELQFTVNALAVELHGRFETTLRDGRVHKRFTNAIGGVADTAARINLIYDWVEAYTRDKEPDESRHLVWEVVALIAAGDVINQNASKVGTFANVEDLLGQHPLIQSGTLGIHLDLFLAKMAHFTEARVPAYVRYTQLRTTLVEARRIEMRLEEFQGRVMGSFVRNKLINDVYLNLVGANFAKQMGVAGDTKRTDLMGMLLLISPPGYGKTTLMEYIANRLGLVFMKINGPAIGHGVTSLDPTEAPNATAREELKKLNLALEMGNNVMIYLDDIQHCNPEFLQKFISLCDAQRKIEGVYQGIARTYDLRGKKVAVVMAGNPYTESGAKFRIPDMLANRADTYNLGDISETAADVFALSFIENAMTSNPSLTEISNRSHEDLYRFVQAVEADSTEGIDFDYGWSAAEAEDMMSVLRKLMRVRDIVLTVNKQYIRSAAQEEDYRTEPSFKLQGSYRNMCRMAEKVFPIMTEAEVDQLILDHYANESQTLTTGAEANFLKFKEMMGTQDPDERARWSEIKTEFNRRQALAGVDDADDMGKVLAQLSAFNANLGHVRNSLEKGFDAGFIGLAETVSHALERAAQAGRAEPIDLAPLVEAIQNRMDVGGGAPTSLPPLQIQASLPESFGKTQEREAAVLESLVGVMEDLREHGKATIALREFLEQFVVEEQANAQATTKSQDAQKPLRAIVTKRRQQ